MFSSKIKKTSTHLISLIIGFCFLIGCSRSSTVDQVPASGTSAKPGQKPVAPSVKSCEEKFRKQADAGILPFINTPNTAADDLASSINVRLAQGMPLVNYWLQLATTTEPQHLKIERASQLVNLELEVLTADFSSELIELKYRHTHAGLPVATLSQKFEISGRISEGTCALTLKSTEQVGYTVQNQPSKLIASGKTWSSDQPQSEVDIKNEWNLEVQTSYFDQAIPLSLQALNLLANPSIRIFKDVRSPLFKSSITRQGEADMLDPASSLAMRFMKFQWKGHPAEGVGAEFIKTIYLAKTTKALLMVENGQTWVQLTPAQWLARASN